MIGTQLYRTQTAPKYILGHSFALGYLVANLVVIGTLWWVLKRENTRRDALQSTIQTGLSGKDVEGKASDQSKGDDDAAWRFFL